MADPILEDLVKQLSKLSEATASASKKMDKFQEGLDSKAIAQYTEAAKKALKNTSDFGKEVAETIDDFRTLQKVTKKLEDQLDDLEEAEKKATKTIKKFEGDWSHAAQRAIKEAEETLATSRKQREEVKKVVDEMGKFSDGLAAANKNVLKFQSLIGEVGESVKKNLSFGALGDHLKEKLGGAAKATFTWGNALGAASEAMKLAYKDLIGVTNLGLGMTFFELRTSAVKFGMTLEQMTEVIQRNRNAINLLGGGIQGVRDFQQVLSRGLEANQILVNRLGQRGATQALSEFTGSLQAMGITVKDQSFAGALGQASDTFLRLNALYGTQADELAKHMKAMVEDEAVQRRLIGLNKQEAQLYSQHLMQMTAELRVRGISLQQIQEFNNRLEQIYDPTKTTAKQRIEQAMGVRLMALEAQRQGQEVDIASANRLSNLIMRGAGSTDEAKQLHAALGPQMQKAQAGMAERARTGGSMIGMDVFNMFAAMGGQTTDALMKFGQQQNIADLRGENLKKAFGDQFDAMVKSNQEMAMVPDSVAKMRTAIEQIEAALNPAIMKAVEALTVFTTALLAGSAGGILKGAGGLAGKIGGALGIGKGVGAAGVVGRMGMVGAAGAAGYGAGSLYYNKLGGDMHIANALEWLGFDAGNKKVAEMMKSTPAAARAPVATGAVSAGGFKVGALTAQFESGKGGVGTISSGAGDPGGVSYGRHQLASKTGTMAKFLASPEGAPFAGAFGGMQPGTAGFNQAYSQVASTQGAAFGAAQEAFIKRTHWEPAMRLAKQLGFDTTNPAIQEFLYSASVQHGGYAKILEAASKQMGTGADASTQLAALWTARKGYVSGIGMNFDKRYGAEQAQQTALLGGPGAPLPTAPTVASATVTAATTTTTNPQLTELQKHTTLLSSIASKIGQSPPAYAQSRKNAAERALS